MVSTAGSDLAWVYSRNRRAAALSNDDIDQYKEPIRQMYLVEGLSRTKVRDRLARGHDFLISYVHPQDGALLTAKSPGRVRTDRDKYRPDQFSKATNRWGFHKQTRKQQSTPTQSSVVTVGHDNIAQVDIELEPAPPSATVEAPKELSKRPRSTDSTASLTDVDRQIQGPAWPLPPRPAKRCKAAESADHVFIRSHYYSEDGTPAEEDDDDFDTSTDYPGSTGTPRPFPIATSDLSTELTDSNASSTLQDSSVEVDELCAEFLASCYMFKNAFSYFAKVSIPFKYKSSSSNTDRRSRMLDLARTAMSSSTREIACVILESELRTCDDSIHIGNDDIGMPEDRSAGEPMTPNESFLFHRHLARIYSYKHHHASEVQQHLDKARRFTGSDGMPNLARLPCLDYWTLHHILDGKDCSRSDELLDMHTYDEINLSLVISPCLRWCKEQLRRLGEIQTDHQFDTIRDSRYIQTAGMDPTSMSQWGRQWDPLALWAQTSSVFAHLWKSLQLSPPLPYDRLTWLDEGLLPGISVTHFLMIVCRLIVYKSRFVASYWSAAEGTPLTKESSIPVRADACMMAISNLLADCTYSPRAIKTLFDKTFCEHHSWAPPTRRENTLVVQVRAELLDCLNSTKDALNRAQSTTPTPPTPRVAIWETTDSREPDSASLSELLDYSAFENTKAFSMLSISDSGSKRNTLMSAGQRSSSIASGSTISLRARRLYLSVLQGNPALARGIESRGSYSSEASGSSSLQRFKEAGSAMDKVGFMASRRRSRFSGLEVHSDWDGDPLLVAGSSNEAGSEQGMLNADNDQSRTRRLRRIGNLWRGR
ncbi:hypothetical protein G7Z17_g11121 [Cylindrodendrum hubeiense]|uniref:Uncharacterized protein n=1 Tax=Cylindrodendrum hubeiense TaxID=595255 RepID=A0A9P5GXM6_9HYPO|nr:hypothetical protein G7Z17_g11121 [Cylindrodendrum hubeiense]